MKDIERLPDGRPKYFYWWTFADGYRTCCAGFDRVEIMHAVEKHGKLIRKEPA